jgi:hypothetical protein
MPSSYTVRNIGIQLHGVITKKTITCLNLTLFNNVIHNTERLCKRKKHHGMKSYGGVEV